MAHCLIIDNGSPYLQGQKLLLDKEHQYLLGRMSNHEQPDIIFDNRFVSRRHCVIQLNNGQVTLTDLQSKHGTLVNDQPVVPGSPIVLRHSDKIILSHGAVSFRLVMLHSLDDETMEFTDATSPEELTSAPNDKLRLYPDKRQCFIGNKHVALSPKEWLLLTLLYKSPEQLIPYDTIRSSVWPERIQLPGQIPAVGIEEINLVVYRLRQKLGHLGVLIKNIRGLGFVFEE